MLYENILNVLTLLATILGLLSCLFKYIKTPKRVYLYLTGFFLASFFSDYYWTIYTLVMNFYPDVSAFLAYLGWNIAYVFILFAVFKTRAKGARRYFHPLMLWPVLTNVCQFFLYISFGGFFNNLWQVSLTTATMVLCMQDITYYFKNKKSGARVPRLSFLVLLYFIFEYAMWTSSCFDWSSGLLDPYPYLSILAAATVVTFAWGAEKDHGKGGSADSEAGWMEYRFQAMLQAITAFIICGACAGGYFIALGIKQSLLESGAAAGGSDGIVRILFITSIIMILAVLLLLYVVGVRYKKREKDRKKPDYKKQSKFNFIFTMAITLALMVLIVFYNSRTLYQSSVTEIYEDGRDVAVTTATDLENYLTVAQATLRVAADTVDLMERNGATNADILQYLTDQTKEQSEQFDESFTGIYAYVNGEFMDGSGWVPPEGYDPLVRDWYKAAVEAEGRVIIVSPYVDAQTGSIVITVAKRISHGDAGKARGVVCLDVIVNHVQKVAEEVNIAGKGYGFVVSSNGFIVAHKDKEMNGKNVADVYGQDVLDGILRSENGRLDTALSDEECVLFTHGILDQWVAVIVVNDAELFEDVYSQLAVNILMTLLVFLLISFFYYFGYKIEQNNTKKVEAINMQVVSSLAEAIDAKDAYTNGHSSRVAKYSKMIAARAGFSGSEQNEIYMMALLHDVGKIGVPDEVINYPGRLSDENYEKIKQHPVVGSKILENIKERPELATGARWHHERFDGGGYPDGLSGENIPVEARIIAVADAYDAMTSRRSYRDVMPQDKVREEIEKCSGTQFDPRFAKIMIRMIDEDKDFTLREI